MRGLLSLLAVIPSLANAECPVSGDLNGPGILLVYESGSTELFIADRPGTTRALLRNLDGTGGNNVFAHGVHLLSLMDVENAQPVLDSLMVFNYPMSVKEMPVPRVGLEWDVYYAMEDISGTTEERQIQSWGDAEIQQFGDCRYTVIPGTIEYQYSGGGHREGLSYFPELGVSFLSSWQDDTMPNADTYTLLDIQVNQ